MLSVLSVAIQAVPVLLALAIILASWIVLDLSRLPHLRHRGDAPGAGRIRRALESQIGRNPTQDALGIARAPEQFSDRERIRPETDRRFDHDYRTPLNAVIGFAEILALEEGNDRLSPRQRQALNEIRNGGLRLLDLVEADSALDHHASMDARAAGSLVFLERIEAVTAVDRITDTLRGSLNLRGIDLSRPKGPAGLAVVADRCHLRRCLVAMTAQAAAQAQPGDRIETLLRPIRDFVEITVAIQSSATVRAVQALTRDPTMDHSDGFADDLEHPAELAAAMNGRIEASPDGQGTRLLLPGGREDRPEAWPRRAAKTVDLAQPGPRRPCLLYVEDNASNIALMRRVIEALGSFDLFVGETGPQGVAMARSLSPDVIILDINLPGFDGLEVKRRLDDHLETRDIPVIALSANASGRDIHAGAEVGFLDYLTKPLDIPALAAALNRAMGEQMASLRRAPRPSDIDRTSSAC